VKPERKRSKRIDRASTRGIARRLRDDRAEVPGTAERPRVNPRGQRELRRLQRLATRRPYRTISGQVECVPDLPRCEAHSTDLGDSGAGYDFERVAVAGHQATIPTGIGTQGTTPASGELALDALALSTSIVAENGNPDATILNVDGTRQI